MIEPSQLFQYSRAFADRAEAEGRGTRFPTVRQAAKRFRCKQQDIIDCVEDAYLPGAYFALAVAFGIQGGGWASRDCEGDWEIEAYPA